MRPTPVHRFYFSQDEVIAALFPSGIPSKARELRMDGDELIVDFVDPAIASVETTSDGVWENRFTTKAEVYKELQDDLPGDRTLPGNAERRQDDRRKIGDNELEADALCGQRMFQTFLEVKTEEAARRIVLERTRARDFGELDTVKSWKANFRDLVGEFEAWKMG